jgi:AcrR family transcriptional regulator
MPRATPKRSTESARKKPSQRRSRETVRAILVAFTRILIARGYAATTTNEVAKLAGVSIGTLYEYFPHKDALVRELLDAHLAEAEAAIAAFDDEQFRRALAQPLARSVEQIVSFTVALHAEQPGLHRVLFEEASRLVSVRKRAGKLEQRLTALVAKLLAEHSQASCSDPQLSAYLVVRTVDALVHGWVTRSKTAPLDATALQRELVKLVLSYVSTRHGGSTLRPWSL